MCGRPSLGVGLGIAGFSLSLTLSVTSFLSQFASVHALGAPAPVDDLRLVDLEAEVLGRRQARRVADRAVDVDHPVADPADEVVVVVPDPVLVARRRARRLDAPEKALLGEDREGVVDRLDRDRTDLAPDRLRPPRRRSRAERPRRPGGPPGAAP